MELCPNGTLYRYLTQYSKGLGEQEVRGVMKDLVEGVKRIRTLASFISSLIFLFGCSKSPFPTSTINLNFYCSRDTNLIL